MIRVLLADDEELIRTAVAALLGLEPDLEVVAQAGDGRSAVEAAVAHRPDVAVVDLEMPGLDGIAVAQELTTAASTAARPSPACATTSRSASRSRRAAIAVRISSSSSASRIRITPAPAAGPRPPA